jgi:glycosyltransferase involved in cell wall biosynthesis
VSDTVVGGSVRSSRPGLHCALHPLSGHLLDLGVATLGAVSDTPPRPCLSVVVPCYNEERTVATLIERVLESPWVCEVVIVDDGSTDSSREILEAVDHPTVRVVFHPHNRGKGAALRTGFAHATGEYVVVQDADLEYDPAEYGSLLYPLERGLADVVYGSRFQSGRPHRVLYFWHSTGNKLLTLASNMFTDLNLTDMETCYKAFRREVLEKIEIEEDRFGFEPEVTAKVAKGGWRIYEVGISYSGRTYAEGKKISARDGVRAMICIVRYSSLADRVLALRTRA